jgi:EpsI family protein
VAALVMLFALHRLICLIWKPSSTAPAPATHVQQPVRATGTNARAGSLRFVMAAAVMLVTAAGLQARPRDEFVPAYLPLSSLPSQIDGWTGTDETIDQPTLDVLGPGEFLLRDYENQSLPQPFINLYVAYFPSQRSGDTIHSPNHCLPGAGWIPISRTLVEIARPDGSSFPANRYVIVKADERQLVLYWFQAHGREVASEYWAKYYLIADSIKMNRSDGALVRLMTPMLKGESADAAQARMMKLGTHFVPLLDTYIPR